MNCKKIFEALLLYLYRKFEKNLAGHELGKYRILNKINSKLTSYFKSDFVYIDNHKMLLDDIDSLRLSINKVYEEFETEIVKKIIKNSDVVVDAGANIGYYTLIFARLVGERGRVYAFEPEPKNFELLTKNIELNMYKNTILIKKALSNKNGSVKLNVLEFTAGHFIDYGVESNHKSIDVPVTSLDEYFNNYRGKIDFIKMDVEGAESNVIEGMTRLLQRTNHIKMMIEFNPRAIVQCGNKPIHYLEWLQFNGFKMYELDSKNKKIKPVDIIELQQNYPINKKKYTNLLCIKGEPNQEELALIQSYM